MDHKQATIEEYKKKYGHVFKYTSNDGKSCILRSPDLKIIDACRTVAGSSTVKFDKAMLENCWLEGDEELRTSDKYMMGIFDWMYGIIKKVDGQLEEL